MTHELDDVLKALEYVRRFLRPIDVDIAYIDKETETLRAFIQRDKWWPIEAAPKNGKTIIVATPPLNPHFDWCYDFVMYNQHQNQWEDTLNFNPMTLMTHFKYLSAPPAVTEGE